MPETLTTRNADCSLTLTVDDSPTNRLHLQYQVRNQGALALYVCNQLQRTVGCGPDATPLLPYLVHVEVRQGSLHVSRAVTDLSFHDGIRLPSVPLLTRLLPGQAYAATVQLATPLLPYRVDGKHPGQAPPSFWPLTFSVEYFQESQGLLTVLQQVPGAPTDTYQLDDFQTYRHKIVAVGPFQQLLPVSNAVAAPARTMPDTSAQWRPWH